MYNSHSTPPHSDPLDVEVFIGTPFSAPSRYLDSDMKKRLTTAVESFRGAVPTPQLIKLFALIGGHICEWVSSG
jgi:hypothetical protein